MQPQRRADLDIKATPNRDRMQREFLGQLALQGSRLALAVIDLAARKLPKTAMRLVCRSLRQKPASTSLDDSGNDIKRWCIQARVFLQCVCLHFRRRLFIGQGV